MIVVGIDGSTNASGIAIMSDGVLMDYDVINLHKIKDTDTRIVEMASKITEYLDNYNVDLIVMEESILKTNVDVVKKLAYVMGAVMFYAHEKGIAFKHVLPTEWRSKACIKQSNKITRAELKKAAVEAVKAKYGIDVSDDIAESVLIAASEFI